MKRIAFVIVALVLTAVPFLAADGLASFDPSWTVRELATSEAVPVKSLANQLELELGEVEGESLSSLGVSRTDAEEAIAAYREGESSMVGSIVAVGMIIVFVSLVVVAFLISLFQHLHMFDSRPRSQKSKSVKSVVGTITSTGDLGERSIAAVVAAIFLHEAHVDAENRLLLTWKRATGGTWRTGGAMPNASYFAAKRGR